MQTVLLHGLARWITNWPLTILERFESCKNDVHVRSYCEVWDIRRFAMHDIHVRMQVQMPSQVHTG